MNGKQLKNSILQWAIQGKLVPQDPNDEPASVLLERIRTEKAKLVKEKKIKKDKNESIIYRGEDNSYYENILATGEVKCIDEEIPFEIPKGWEWTRIGNIFNHASGKQQSSNNKGSGTPQKFITTSNLYWGYFLLDEVKVMNFTEEEIKNCSATKGDLLVCEGGAGYGRSAIWNEDYDICLQNHVHRLRPCVSGICEYVYHFIYLLKESNNLASVGTAMPGLSANRLKGLLLPLPPLSEQNRIVAKLKELSSQIEKYSKVQSELNELNTTIKESIKKSVLHEVIQGKLVPQISEEGTAQELLEQIQEEKQRLVNEGKLKKSALATSTIFRGDDNKYWEKIGNNCVCINDEIPFEIPNNWEWCRLKDIGKTETGTTPSKLHPEYFGNYIPFLGPANIFGSKIISETQGLSDIGVEFARVVPPNSILQVCIGGSIGKCAIVDKPVTFNQQINSITPYLCNVEFVYIVLQSDYFRLAIIDKATGTATPIINRGNWETLLFPLPPLKEQQRIVKKYKEATSIMSR